MNESRYALGYSEDEAHRLTRQAAFFEDLTADVLRRAGIGPGMHVLDLGCGVGDVSLLAVEWSASPVRSWGLIERPPQSRRRAGERGL
jgi:cyclopropane fatty-acyl-phospholipid synthase-like methyltransferase